MPQTKRQKQMGALYRLLVSYVEEAEKFRPSSLTLANIESQIITLRRNLGISELPLVDRITFIKEELKELNT